ncbi:MAG: sensor histidine kinase [Bacteroidales bacterium]|nr:sensor histidine kinase [Bacteroidales bacterium]
MVRLAAIIISIILQIIAASIAIRFMKLTKYRLSWILLSVSFVFMSVRTFIHLIQFFWGEPSEKLSLIDEWLGVVISIMVFVGVILIRELFYSLKRAELERIRAERRVINAIINTEENEKKRFAKELHDGLGPLLSSVRMSLSALTGKVTGKGGEEILGSANSMTNEAIATIKEISNNLSPHILSNFGLASAINTFTTKLNQTKALPIEFKTNMAKVRIDPDAEVVIYRAVCELINNSIKHSGASKIEIDLNHHEKFVTLHFSENGRGFDPELLKSEDKKGMGISNIETRVRSINGVFILESTPGKGTNALIKVTI